VKAFSILSVYFIQERKIRIFLQNINESEGIFFSKTLNRIRGQIRSYIIDQEKHLLKLKIEIMKNINWHWKTVFLLVYLKNISFTNKSKMQLFLWPT